jgi:opacity protein-like surface antigen
MTKRKTAALAAGTLALMLGAAVPAAAVPVREVATPTAAASRTGTFYGTYQHADGCVYLRSAAGYHYLLEGYTMGRNGGLYKKGGGFIAYPGWRIAAHGTQYNKSSTTLCTTWGAYRRIKATSIYAY